MKKTCVFGFSFLILVATACSSSSDSGGDEGSNGETSQITFNLETTSASESLSAGRKVRGVAANYEIVCLNAEAETIAAVQSDDSGEVTIELGNDQNHICTILDDDFNALGVFVADDSEAASGEVTTSLKPSGDADLGTCTLDTDTGVMACDGEVSMGDIKAASTTAGIPNDLTVSEDDPCGLIAPTASLATEDLDSDGSGLADLLDNDSDGNGKCDNVDDLEKKFCDTCDHVELSIDNANHYCNPGNDSYRADQRFYSAKEISSISVEGPSWTDNVTIADSPSLPDDVTTYANWKEFNNKQLAACSSGDAEFHCMPVIAETGSLGTVMQEGDVFKYTVAYADDTTATHVASINMVLRKAPEDVKIEGSEPGCSEGSNGSFINIETSGAANAFTLQFTIPAGLQVGLHYRMYCTALTVASGTACTAAIGSTSSFNLSDETAFAGDQRTSATESQDSGLLTISTDLLPTSSTNAWTCGVVATDDVEDFVDSHGYLIQKSGSTCTTYSFGS